METHTFLEKLFFGISHLLGGLLMMANGIFSSGEWRWLSLTGGSSLFAACAVSLIFKKQTESMQLTAGRSMIAVACGVFGTREIVVRYGIEAFQNDAVRLMGAAALMTVLGFTVGYFVLLKLAKRSSSLADKALDRYLPKDDEKED